MKIKVAKEYNKERTHVLKIKPG
uniref:Uncharacterized protein n=1 Tax=Arundo donax TaxID=35708 RepID=A0A0A9ASF1_ARUDO